MRWVKTTVSNARPSGYTSEGGYSASVDTEGESEDPFQDIESLREDDTTNRNDVGLPYDKEAQEVVAAETSRIEEIDDDEEAELTSFSFDGPSQGVVHIMTGEEGSMEGIVIEDDVTTDEDYDDEEVTQLTAMSAAMSIDDQHEHDDSQDQTWDDEQETEQQSFIHAPRPVPMGRGPHLDTPLPPRPASAAPTPIRSALKSTSITPLPMSRNPPPHLSYQTPSNHAHYRRRSVSFSDGKREGQIAGLGRGTPEEDVDPPELDGTEDHGASLAPSVRSKRIAEMMGHLAEDSKLRLDFPNLIVFRSLVFPGFTGESANAASPEHVQTVLQPIPTRRPSNGLASNAHNSMLGVSRNVFSCPPTSQLLTPASANMSNRNNATFLTEASFGVAHDRLVEVITDVQPFEPYWEELKAINLSGKRIDSVARLKEFLPKLDALSL